jgi:hypothetical protein
MTSWLKEATAATVKLGPFLDDTDGKTVEDALTISQADIRISKNGGDIAQTSNAAGATHDELGYYDVPLSTTDTNTLGTLRVMVHEPGALPVWQDFMVVPANVWDSLFGADKLQVDVTEIEGSDATNQIRDAVVDDATRIDASALNTLSGKAPSKAYLAGTANADGDIQANEMTGNFPGSVASVAGAVGSVTGNVSGSVGSVTAAVTVGSINAGAITAAAIATDAIDADALKADAVSEIQSGLATAAALTTVDGVVDAIKAQTDKLAFSGTGPYDVKATLDSETVVVGTNNDKMGYSLAANQDVRNVTGAISDKSGYSLSAAGVSAVQSGLSTLTAQQVWEYGTRTLSSFGTLVQSIWEYATRALTDKTGFALTSAYDAAKSAASQISVNSIATAVDTEVAAILAAVDTEVAAIKNKTDLIPESPASTGDIPSAVQIRQEIDANSTKLDVSVSTRLASVDYTAPDNTSIAGIKTQTDQLHFDGDNVQAVANVSVDTEVIADAVVGALGAMLDPLDNVVPGDYEQGTAGYALGRIGTNVISVVSPITSGGTVTIVQGDDYYAEDGRAIEWVETADTTAWPNDLTGATITFGAGEFTKAGSVVTPTGSSKKVRVELSAEDTASLVQGKYDYQVQATINGRAATIVKGTLVVIKDCV